MLHPNSDALVLLALDAQGFTQKELSLRINVSPTQISKWRKGDSMSVAMEKELRNLAGIGERDPQFVLWAGNLENAEKWEGLIHYLADYALELAETGYNTSPLEAADDLLCSQTFSVLHDMGVTIPAIFPKELDNGEKGYDPDKDEDVENSVIFKNPYSALILRIFQEYTNVYGFYAAYVLDLEMDADLDLFETAAEGMHYDLLPLAASKVRVDPRLATKFNSFRRQIRHDVEEGLNVIKEQALRHRIPLRAELMDMVYMSGEELSMEAERESFDFNKGQLHPDIYMNELLCGMRAIHQILPVILKKLDIDFKLDTSDLRLDGRETSTFDADDDSAEDGT
ncbi:helix-turn-helix transcriptional regulator [Rhizobium laguerreae]|uniref:helix-turn-helix domain-containing protein n=1 Tax=Rhizobium laguerreae TaxID=1076926 RepID=UPI001C92B6A9|nr:helix-turn-helix transcriptional regulator [Rhizobium laguerreae]MBY3151372.1 helix-turn-helix transcriptional regulator [Rhizobium laguerreae]